ncbi:MAG: ATP synthase F0 subunit B [Bdellovibrio sp.]|nr:ATP synthase F0 subunit B [Bdellovibrio sp.]
MITKDLKFYLIVNVFWIGVAASSSEATHHEPSVYDLKWAAVNFIILFSFMIYKLKGPIRKSFQDKRANIQSLFNHAAEKHKDAEMKLDIYEAKLNTLEEQSKKVFDDAKIDVLKFDHDTQEENTKLIERLNREAKDKIEHEQQQIVHKIGAELLSTVIAKTKTKISESAELKSNLAASLLKKAK